MVCRGGTDPLAQAQRELEEEAGIVAKKWTNLGGFLYPVGGNNTEKCHIFLDEDLELGDSKNEATEDITIKLVSKEELIDMIKNGVIICGQTMSVWYKYLLHKT